VGLGGSYMLAYRGIGPWPAMQSPLAFWLMSALALALAAALLLAVLWSTLRRRE
jgi:MATE family multidrug resistance protein